MKLLKNFAAVLGLLAIVWVTFLLVSYILASTLFPAIEQASQNILASIMRVIVGLATFMIWILIWYTLTKIWLYKVLLKE
ncbi:MAG: hypothetical protein DRN68_01080 [Thaumarchaeota archaeon]|nr:MAG: hypothetical protein DRN68_01080 [Nitrososphaerota archaeon]